MGEVARPLDPMTVDEFLAWCETRPEREKWELVDNRPVARHLEAMGERVDHAETKAKLFLAITDGIRAGALPCRAYVDRMAVKVDDRIIYEPDVMVQCGERPPKHAQVVSDPLLVVEVVSPSSRRIDQVVKRNTYFLNPSIVHYLIVDPEAHAVFHHRRGPDGIVLSTAHDTGAIQIDPPGLSLDIDALFAD